MNFIVRNMFYLENLFLFGLEYEKKLKILLQLQNSIFFILIKFLLLYLPHKKSKRHILLTKLTSLIQNIKTINYILYLNITYKNLLYRVYLNCLSNKKNSTSS